MSQRTCSAGHVAQELREKLCKHKVYIGEHGIDMPEVLNWKWTPGPSAGPGNE
jgi:xylulose-5-phosphate/fructose-6-phosphate phosphoketolase